MTQEESKCIICGDLHIDGIRVRGKLICSKCEQELVGVQADEPLYEGYKQGMKAIWDFDPNNVLLETLEQDC